jgi:hypothetical protein
MRATPKIGRGNHYNGCAYFNRGTQETQKTKKAGHPQRNTITLPKIDLSLKEIYEIPKK